MPAWHLYDSVVFGNSAIGHDLSELPFSLGAFNVSIPELTKWQFLPPMMRAVVGPNLADGLGQPLHRAIIHAIKRNMRLVLHVQ